MGTSGKKKAQQHQALLTQLGYDVHVKPLQLGSAGMVYEIKLEVLVDRHQCLCILTKLHIQCCNAPPQHRQRKNERTHKLGATGPSFTGRKKAGGH